MNIVMVSSEATPFARTGGLGDSVTELAEELAAKDQTVTLILPYYRQIAEKSAKPLPPWEPLPVELQVRVGSRVVAGRVLRTRLAGGAVMVVAGFLTGGHDPRIALRRSRGRVPWQYRRAALFPPCRTGTSRDCGVQ